MLTPFPSRRAGIILKAIGAVFLLLILAIVGAYFFFTNKSEWIRKGAEKGLTFTLQVPATVSGGDADLRQGSITLTGITIANPEGFDSPHAMKFGRVLIDAEPRSLTTETPVIEELRFTEPDITVEVKKTGTNLEALEDNVARLANPNREVKFRIQKLVIEGSTARAAIPYLGGQTIAVPLEDIIVTDIGGLDGTVDQQELARVVLDALTDQVRAEGANLIPEEALGAFLGDTTATIESLRRQAEDIQSQARDLENQAREATDAIRGILNRGRTEQAPRE